MNAPQTLLIPDYPNSCRRLSTDKRRLSAFLMQVLLFPASGWSGRYPTSPPSTAKSYDTLRTTDRYLLPRFGESAFPTGAARWPLSECLEWFAKPDEEKTECLSRARSPAVAGGIEEKKKSCQLSQQLTAKGGYSIPITEKIISHLPGGNLQRSVEWQQRNGRCTSTSRAASRNGQRLEILSRPTDCRA